MKLLTTAQAGAAVGLSEQRIRALCAHDPCLIPGATKVGRAWLIPTGFHIVRSGTRGPTGKLSA